MLCWLELLQSILCQPSHQSCLAGIVQALEEEHR